jgi:hypothetical protein
VEDTNKWLEFKNLAQTLFLKGQEIEKRKPTIQIAIEPSFADSVFLQLVINDEYVQWYRTTWLKHVDAPKFLNIIETLKYIGQTITPTIKKETGTVSKDNLKGIMDFAKGLSIKPNLEKLGGFTLDGTYYTLTIGVESIQTTFKWHHLPENWTDLKVLADMLEDLNKEIR